MSPSEVQEIEGSGSALSSGYFLLRGTSAELRFDLVIGGKVKAADEPPKVTVTRDNGEVLVDEGNTTGTEGEYAFVLSPEQTTQLDILTADWKVTVAGVVQTFTRHHEIVGGFLTTVAAIQNSLPKGASATVEEIEGARTLAEEWLEGECGVAFRPRYGRDAIDGCGTQTLLLARPKLVAVNSVTVSGEPAPAFAFDPSGVVHSEEQPWKEGFQNVEVVYEHGFVQVPGQVSRAATLLARLFLVPDPSDYDGRASSISTETAHYTLITPGIREAITAIPEVNVVMNFFNFTGIA